MTLKYNDIMEKIEVTDEMRERILANVSEKASKRKKKVLAFPNRIRMSSLAACAAIVILCAAALPKIFNMNKPTEGDLASVNGIIECKDINELSRYAGFEMNELTDIPFDIVECTYSWWFDSMAQIEYVGDNQVITYRIAESEGDISGDYNDYSSIREETIHDHRVTIKGNGEQTYLAIWTAGKYSYSISSLEGISYTEMLGMID